MTMDWKAKLNYTTDTLVSDLDRCTHGRHMGDVCSGCPRQVSEGNLLLPPGMIIGTSLGRNFMIRVPLDPKDRHDARAWYAPLDGVFEQMDYMDAVEAARTRAAEEDSDG